MNTMNIHYATKVQIKPETFNNTNWLNITVTDDNGERSFAIAVFGVNERPTIEVYNDKGEIVYE